MNKNHLVRIASRRCCSKDEAKQVIETVCEHMVRALTTGEKVVLTGFGAFHPYERKERKGVHPRKPEMQIIIPGMKAVRFIPGKELKSKLK